MKPSFPVSIINLLLLLILFNFDLSAQQLADEIRSKLSEVDQKKLLKADDLFTEGDLILSKAGYPGDDQLINSNDPENKQNKKYFSKRFEAAGYYKDANSGKFQIYEKNIKDFWKNYSGEQYKLESVKKTESIAIDQFQQAVLFRNVAEKKRNLSERLQLLMNAETNEKSAILQLQKVLFTYLNYPAQFNASWFSDTVKTEKKEPVKPLITPTINVTETKKDVIKPSDKNSDAISADIVKGNDTEGEQSLYSLVDVNENQIDVFNQFIQKKYPNDYEKYIIDFSKIDYSDLQSLKNSWYKYKFGQLEDSAYYLANQEQVGTPSDTAEQLIKQDLLASDTKNQNNSNELLTIGTKPNLEPAKKDTKKGKDKKTETSANGEKYVKESQSETKIVSADPGSKSKTKPLNVNETKTPAKHSGITSTEPIAHGFLFKVQIAACRITVDQNILSGIYGGNEKITQSFEDEWYKYTIGEFNTYRDARQMRDQLNVPGAFVVAYLNGKRIRITPSVARKQSPEIPLPVNIQPQYIEFRIQIAASKNELSDELLKNIYNGDLEIISVLDDGWYKYSITGGNKLETVIELSKTLNIPGAFIVAYYNNKQINLRSAIQLTKFN